MIASAARPLLGRKITGAAALLSPSIAADIANGAHASATTLRNAIDVLDRKGVHIFRDESGVEEAKGSVFEGTAASHPALTIEDLAHIVNLLRANPDVATATHPTMFAFSLPFVNNFYDEETEAFLARCTRTPLHPTRGFFDDGEVGAGTHLLGILERESHGRVGVAVVVTRWYGGVHLGARRFKMIASVAAKALRRLSV